VQSNLAARLLTAAVVSPLLLWLLFFGPAWGWFLLIFAATGIAAAELFAMTHPEDRVLRVAGVGVCLAVSAGVYWGNGEPRVLLTVLFGATIVSLLLPLFRPGDIPTAGGRMMAGIAIPWYLALLTPLALLRKDMGAIGPGYVLMTLMFAWMSDTWGYFVGRRWGKTPFTPRSAPRRRAKVSSPRWAAGCSGRASRTSGICPKSRSFTRSCWGSSRARWDKPVISRSHC
jgi:phosphatidate cytidylyltransferase